jgi:hypothetical protein
MDQTVLYVLNDYRILSPGTGLLTIQDDNLHQRRNISELNETSRYYVGCIID